MRGLIVLALVVLVLALVGWISFSNDPDRASVNVETDKIKADTNEMLEAGDNMVDRARESINDEVRVDTDADGVVDTEVEVDRVTDDPERTSVQ